MSEDPGCICAGNWRKIVAENEHRIGKSFWDKEGRRWVLFGIVHASDDFYYGMVCRGEYRLLSCVGSIEKFGYEQADD